MSDTIYCYPDSDVLINKMDIRDQAKLEEAERRLTMFRMSDLLDVPVKGDFDLDPDLTDADMSSGLNGNRGSGDGNSYPQMTSVSLGVSVTF